MDLDKKLNKESGFTHAGKPLTGLTRLLRLDARSPFRYTFEIVRLDALTSIDYRALSYTWGEAATTPHALRTIHVGGQPFLVRLNLYQFLETAVEKGENGLFFIDAICIDQLDLAERASQVQYMTQIYRKADEVFAWLGKPGPEDLAQVQTLVPVAQGQDPTTWSSTQLKAYRYLTHHPYWSRIWIVQEVLLARNVTVLCGHCTFPLAMFGHAKLTSDNHQNPAENIITHRLRTINRLRRDSLEGGARVGGLDDITAALKAPRHRSVIYQSTIPDPIYGAIKKFGKLNCTDPRDRLYGFLGIVREASRVKVNADYTKGVDYAFYQALKIGLEELVAERSTWERHPWALRHYQDVKSIFGIDDAQCRDILEQVMDELRASSWPGGAKFESYWQTNYQVDAGDIGGLQKLQDEVRKSEGPTVPDPSVVKGPFGWLLRFHKRQSRLIEKLYVKFSLSTGTARLFRLTAARFSRKRAST